MAPERRLAPGVKLDHPFVKKLLERYGPEPISVEAGGEVREGTVQEAFEQCPDLSMLADRDPGALLAAIRDGVEKTREYREV